MNEHYPYPDIEHYEEPKNPLQVLDEELRFYPDGESLRGGVVAIGRIYQNTELLYCFKKYACLMNVVSTVANPEQPRLSIDNDFYAGTILGTHVMAKPAPKHIRRRMLGIDVLEDYSPWSESGIDPANQSLQLALEELAHYKKDEWRELLELQPEEHQERILDLGQRLFEDIPDAKMRNDRWESFTAGYLFASNLIYSGFALEEA